MTSSYYYQLMLDISQQKRGLELKREEYVNYKKKLVDLNNIIAKLPSNMIKAEKSFAKGGYISGGETLSKGELETQADHAEEVYDNLKNIISKMDMSISDMAQKISKLSNDYQSAQYSYNAAKRQENKK